MATSNEKPALKKGQDGLTKYQRYYRGYVIFVLYHLLCSLKMCRHPEVKEKNRERERKRREEQKIQRGPTSTNTKHPSHTIATTEQRYTIDKDINRSTHPRDFFALAPLFDEKMFNEAVNSLSIAEDRRIQLDRFDELELMLGYRANIVKWAKGWGGVTLWDIGLNESFNAAVEEDRVELWREQVSNHMNLGRKLLGRLHEMEGRLPKAAWMIRDLWRLKIELVEILVKGITILEIKTSILPSAYTMRYTDEQAAMGMDSESAMATDSDLDGADGDDDEDDSFH